MDLVVEVRSISGLDLELTEPLPDAVPATAALVGYAVEHPLTAAETELTGSANAIWQATIDGSLVEWHQPFRVTRQHVASYTLSAPALTKRYGIVSELQPTTDGSLVELIDAAWTEIVERDLNAMGLRPERIRSWEVLENMHAVACVVHLLRMDPRYDPDFKESWMEEYSRAKNAAFEDRAFWYADEEEDVTPTEQIPRRRKGFAL